MAILPILKFPDPRLKLVAEPVASFDDSLLKMCTDLQETMYKFDGIGLAATQCNIQQRIVIIDISDSFDQPMQLINPVITQKDGSVTREEGCISFPGIYAKVTRSAEVTVEYFDLQGKAQQLQADGLLAVCIQHEIDHLDGITFFDHLSTLKQKLIRSKLEKQRDKIS
ncbi:MAG TPA: peptide deformylase [Gammaproteobacteria bacterium]|nr:peptide deformylase [Gammaproteobacteria bacterium]